jgi:hypothetical protein
MLAPAGPAVSARARQALDASVAGPPWRTTCPPRPTSSRAPVAQLVAPASRRRRWSTCWRRLPCRCAMTAASCRHCVRHATRGAWCCQRHAAAALGRLLVARAHASAAPRQPACWCATRSWAGEGTRRRRWSSTCTPRWQAALAGSVGCRPDEARHLLADRLDLAGVDAGGHAAAARCVHPARPARCALPIGPPPLPGGAAARSSTRTRQTHCGHHAPCRRIADRRRPAPGCHGYKRLMDWAQPRQRASAPAGPKRKTRPK